MSKANEPLIRLEPGGRHPILSYNLPEPAVYFESNFIELGYDEDVFTNVAYNRSDDLDPEPVEPILPPDEEEIVDPTPPPDDPTLPPDFHATGRSSVSGRTAAR